MNFQQNQQLKELKENFKERIVDMIAWHIGCFAISLTAAFALKGAGGNSGQQVVVVTFFFAIIFTVSVAFKAIREMFVKKGYLPSIFPYVILLFCAPTSHDAPYYTLGYVLGWTIGIITVDISISTWKLYQTMRKVKDGTSEYLSDTSPFKDIVKPLKKELELFKDIENLKEKHGIKDISVFLD